jgi:hypothetical protein
MVAAIYLNSCSCCEKKIKLNLNQEKKRSKRVTRRPDKFKDFLMDE